MVESLLGSGSRFVVAFPSIAEPVDRQPVGSSNGHGDLAGRTLLVVDDEADVRRIVARMGTHFGMQVREANDGDQALTLLNAHNGRDIDIVLLDLTMPVKSGRATLNEMRARGIATPVIISSGYSSESIEEEDGVAAFVQKPFRLEDLRAAIVGVLGSGERLSRVTAGSSPASLQQ